MYRKLFDTDWAVEVDKVLPKMVCIHGDDYAYHEESLSLTIINVKKMRRELDKQLVN